MIYAVGSVLGLVGVLIGIIVYGDRKTERELDIWLSNLSPEEEEGWRKALYEGGE